MKTRGWLLAACLTFQFAPALLGQSAPFQLFIQDPKGNSTGVSNGSSITVSADALNQPVTLTLQARYIGTGTAKVTGPPQMLGSPEFTAGEVKSPATLNPGDSFTVPITFNPTVTTQATAQILVPYTETDSKGVLSTSGTIALNIVGTVPRFVITYLFASDQNVIALNDGDTLTFPATSVAGNSVVAIGIQNLGSGPGPLSSVKVTGTAFQLQSLPLLPGSIAANSALQFTIKYLPTKAQTDTGTLQIVFPDHTVTVNLVGTGTMPVFTYELLQNDKSTPIAPGQSIDLPAVSLSAATPFSIRVRNTGNGPGVIPSVSITGQGFQITDAPAFPQTLAPGDSITLGLSVLAPTAGNYKAQLRIGADVFTFNTQGLGSIIQYSYSTGGGTTTILPSGFVVFSPVQLGQTASTTFTIQNIGTAPATVTSISLQTVKSAFSLLGLPPLPLTIGANSSLSFTILFTPTAAGPNSAVLLIDTQPFNLTGSGNPPPALPTVQFTGSSGAQQPLQQPFVGLSLAAPYPLPVTGTLVMTEVPDGFSPDPAVQFATGGQTVAFTIPANSLQAVFPNGTTSVKLQTGSVSGNITLTASFSTTGGVDITPVTSPVLRFTVPASAPQLVSAQLTATAANGFTVQVTGVATSRKLTRLNFTFKPAPNVTLASNQVAVDVSSAATAWFQSSASTPFGGQFAIAVPFTLTSSSTTAGTSGSLQSVSVTIENDLGTSSAITAQLQ